MVFEKIVGIDPVTQDRYGRTVAWVYVDGVWVNKELLSAGLAWHSKRYSKEKELAELETEARARIDQNRYDATEHLTGVGGHQ